MADGADSRHCLPDDVYSTDSIHGGGGRPAGGGGGGGGGEKRQTIRGYRKVGRNPKAGDTLYLYTGMRTKQCRKLDEAECLTVAPIRITQRGVVLRRFLRGPPGADCEARLDGFAVFAEMRDWFQKTHGLPFKGLLIRWKMR